MMRRPGDLAVLRTVLRTRIGDPARLAEILGEGIGSVEAAMRRLEADGLIVRGADGTRAAPAPQRPVIEAALAEMAARREALDAASTALAGLSTRLRDWVGAESASRAVVRMELLHGPDAIIDAWWWLVEQPGPRDVFACVPDAAALRRIGSEWDGRDSREASRIRVIVARAASGAAPAAAPALRDRGIELRTLDWPPGWFAGADEDRSAFPTAWGVSWPLSVRTLRDPVASQSLRSFFDELWRLAAPVDEGPNEWEPVLRLLAKGHDDAAVASALGISERTVRRRVEEAMTDLGATNRFTLGRAWARRARRADR